MRILLVLLLGGCASQAGSSDAGHLVLDAQPATSCADVQANPSIPHGAIVGEVDTHYPCTGALFCSIDCANVRCLDGTLRVSEAGRVCFDVGTSDAGP